MELETFLERNREAILARWFDFIVGTYPRVTSEFLAKQKDQFRNPVGHAIARSIGLIYDQLVQGMDKGELSSALDAVIRIRSVQEFTPSDAVSFVFQLKTVIREVMDDQPSNREQWKALAGVEARIDRIALLAFEKYTECRERLYEIRNDEMKRRTMKLLERVNAAPGIFRREEEPSDDRV